MTNTRFTYKRMSFYQRQNFTETVCDTCDETLLESESRFSTDDEVLCEWCAKQEADERTNTRLEEAFGC